MATLAVAVISAIVTSEATAAGATTATLAAIQVATAAATVAAAYVDQKYIYPLFQPTTNTQGPRIDDLQLQTGSEGSLMHYGVGAENRIAGTVIWLSDLIEVKRTEGVEGGKGGGGGSKQTTYDYYLSCAIGVCEGPITSVKKIWADSKLIYDADGGLGSGDGAGYTVTSFQPAGDENINVAGGTGGFRVNDLVRFGDQDHTYEVRVDFNEGDTTLVIDPPGLIEDVHTGDTVTLVQGGDPDNANKDRRAHRIRIYLGDERQVPDSIIAGYVGAESTPAFRGTAYVVIEGLALRDFGNRLPQFSFLVEVQTHESVAGALYNLIHRADIADAEMNLDYVAKSVRGYVVTGPMEIIRQIEPIMQAYDVVTRESNGVLHFFTRGYEDQLQVNPDDLVAQEGPGGGSDKGNNGRPFTITDPSGYNLPREVNVRYLDPTADYQSGNQRYSRNDSFTTQVENVDVPLVMHPADARDMAATRLWRSYAERLQISLTLPPRYFLVEENDILTVDYDDEQYTIRVAEVNQGDNFLVEVRGVVSDTTEADEAVDCARRLNVAEPVNAPQPMAAAVLDVPAVREADAVDGGVYVAGTTVFGQANFTGAGVYESVDDVTYTQVTTLNATATMGKTTDAALAGQGTLPDGPTGLLDMVSTVDVMLSSGDLESVTKDQLLNGANRAWVGTELIGFQMATQLSPMVYRLSNLLRGLRATATSGHHTADNFVLLSPVNVGFRSLQGGAIGTRRYMKFVQDGQTLDEVPSVPFVYRAATLQQPPPCHVRVSRDATTHDATVAWKRRTRSFVGAFAPYKPLGAEQERYEVDVYAGTSATGSVLRTETVTSPSFSYSKANQDADTGSATVQQFYCAIYQVNEQVGRGVPAYAQIG